MEVKFGSFKVIFERFQGRIYMQAFAGLLNIIYDGHMCLSLLLLATAQRLSSNLSMSAHQLHLKVAVLLFL